MQNTSFQRADTFTFLKRHFWSNMNGREYGRAKNLESEGHEFETQLSTLLTVCLGQLLELS